MAKLSFKLPLCFPTSNESESASCSTSSSAFDVFSIWDLDHFNRCIVVTHDCLICISLMTYDV